jgi:hypothetical protein
VWGVESALNINLETSQSARRDFRSGTRKNIPNTLKIQLDDEPHAERIHPKFRTG